MSLGPWADIKFFGKTFLNLMDYLASNLLMPLGGIAITIFAGWVVGQRMREEVDDSGKAYQMVSIWLWVLRTAAPGAVIWILLSGL